jgi:hypothetical protein
MFALFARYFEGSRDTFARDLDEKRWALLLTAGDEASGTEPSAIAGFSTLTQMELPFAGRTVSIFYSGDTVMDRRWWGSMELPQLWSRYVFQVAQEPPEREFYWFLISSGFRTYRYLPLFFRHFVPNRSDAAPAELQRLLDTIARNKFGSRYDPATGIVRLEHRTPLRPGISEPGERERRNADIRFFLERNPRHAEGDELACLVRIEPANLTRAGERMVHGRPLTRP